MKQRVYRLLLCYLSFAILTFSSCSRPIESQSLGQVDENCMQPKFKFAFPVNDVKETRAPRGNILPLSPWQSITLLPEGPTRPVVFIDTLEFSRALGNSVELWMRRLIIWGVKPDEMKSSLFIYQTGQNIWQELPNAFEGVSTEITNLYSGNDGNIWAVGIAPTSSTMRYPSQDQRNISLYDEKEQKFKPLAFSEEIPSGWVVYDRQRNLFWVFNNRDAIYSINPETLAIKKQVEIPSLKIISQASISISPDGDIYIVNTYNLELWTQSSVEFLRFDPDSNDIEKLRLPDTLILDPVLQIFLDSSNNLWLGDQAWKTPDGIWYDVIRSPLFITPMPESPMSYQWDLPEIVLESFDNQLWFKSFNGMVSLDPEKGEWCWFTTYQSNIIEDADHNLWMIADGKLYKYPLKP